MEEYKLGSQSELALNSLLPLQLCAAAMAMVVRGTGGRKGGSLMVAPVAPWWGPENSHWLYPHRRVC